MSVGVYIYLYTKFRRVSTKQNPTVDRDTVVGRTIFADVIYMDVPSRQGSSYAVVMIDSASGFMTGFFVALRSDIPLALSEHILKIRADPELHCPNFCKKLVVDPAGEWHRSNKFFMHQMVKLALRHLLGGSILYMYCM